MVVVCRRKITYWLSPKACQRRANPESDGTLSPVNFSLAQQEELIKFAAGGGPQSIHKEASLCTIQEDLAVAKEIACVRPDGRVPKDGESIIHSSYRVVRGSFLGLL